MNLSQADAIIFGTVVLVCALAFVPIIPAILIFILFPSGRVAVTGKFSGFNVKTTGAFAGYFLIFTCISIIIKPIIKEMPSIVGGSWKIESDVIFYDNGKKLDLTTDRLMIIETIPKTIDSKNGVVEIRVPEIEGKIPQFFLTSGEMKSKKVKIDINNPDAGIVVDKKNRIVKIEKIELFRRAGGGINMDQ
ncbi:MULTISPECIES: hypothetical protein [unclassified Azospirillum]|uniref:hypothetical protein n=1 Tax=unclassified Azospirillum TaxID=2630922 RepID=UPI000B6BB626|nr:MULTISPECIES: hypothetical protein [unclassified Azospirillum]SNS40111.1 hypothetical protein SAMN05880556_104259 [Azospirillum sp. RU38E]SNS58570.1 hypothetical protein SAMN05880591_104259 [Azospirillum sp. RU37A]